MAQLTKEQMIQEILTAIQNNDNLLIVMKMGIANNIGNAPVQNIYAMCVALGLPTDDGLEN